MDNKKILEKTKMKIAISNAKKENIVMKKDKLGKFIGIAACVVISTTGVAFATNEIIKKFGDNSSDGVQIAIDNQYYAEPNTEYKDANGISTSIDSFLIDDYNFDININLKFEDKNILNEMLENDGRIDIMDLKIVNENNEKIFATRELETEEMLSQYKTEQEAMENYDSYMGAYSNTAKKINDNEVKLQLTATGSEEEFPASKKLKISFNKIRNRHFVSDEEIIKIYQGKWEFEVDVPEKMSKSSIVKYKLGSISEENYKLESAKVSNTAFKIKISSCDGLAFKEEQYIENEKGKKFYSAARSDGDGGLIISDDGTQIFYNTFNLTNFDATDKLTVHLFKESGEEVIIKLVVQF